MDGWTAAQSAELVLLVEHERYRKEVTGKKHLRWSRLADHLGRRRRDLKKMYTALTGKLPPNIAGQEVVDLVSSDEEAAPPPAAAPGLRRVADQALRCVLGHPAARAALRPSRDALRLASKGVRAAYDAHVTAVEVGDPSERTRRDIGYDAFQKMKASGVRFVAAPERLADAARLCAAAAAWPLQSLRVFSTPEALEVTLAAAPASLRELRICAEEPVPEHCGWAGAPRPVGRPELLPTAAESLGVFKSLEAARLPVCSKLAIGGLTIAADVIQGLDAHCPGLQELEVERCAFEKGAAVPLERWPRLARLCISDCNLSECGPEAVLGRGAGLAAVERLDVTNCGAGAQILAALSAQAWPSLRCLNLVGNVRAVARRRYYPRDEYTAEQAAVDAEWAAATMKLARAPWAAALCSLGLPVVEGAARALARAALPELRALRVQLLGANHRTHAAAVQHIVSAPWAAALESFSVSCWEVEDPDLEQRSYRDGKNIGIGSAAARALFDAPWPCLRRLSLASTWISDDEIADLEEAQPPWAAQLVYLDLSHNLISPYGGLLLAAAPWPSLVEIYLRDVSYDCNLKEMYYDHNGWLQDLYDFGPDLGWPEGTGVPSFRRDIAPQLRRANPTIEHVHVSDYVPGE